MNIGELSYDHVLERMLRAEARVAELEEQLRREQEYCIGVDMERMELWKKLEERGAA